MQSQRWMSMLMSVILSAVEVRHDERVVEGEAQKLRIFGVVERLSQRCGEAGSAAHHASGVSAGEELQAQEKTKASVYAHAIARAVRTLNLGLVYHEHDVGLKEPATSCKHG